MQKPQTTFKDGYPQENKMESEGKVEACSVSRGETKRRDGMSNLIDKIVSRGNLNKAYKRVKANKGSSGVDGMEVGELYSYLILNKATLITQIKFY